MNTVQRALDDYYRYFYPRKVSRRFLPGCMTFRGFFCNHAGVRVYDRYYTIVFDNGIISRRCLDRELWSIALPPHSPVSADIAVRLVSNE